MSASATSPIPVVMISEDAELQVATETDGPDLAENFTETQGGATLYAKYLEMEGKTQDADKEHFVQMQALLVKFSTNFNEINAAFNKFKVTHEEIKDEMQNLAEITNKEKQENASKRQKIASEMFSRALHAECAEGANTNGNIDNAILGRQSLDNARHAIIRGFEIILPSLFLSNATSDSSQIVPPAAAWNDFKKKIARRREDLRVRFASSDPSEGSKYIFDEFNIAKFAEVKSIQLNKEDLSKPTGITIKRDSYTIGPQLEKGVDASDLELYRNLDFFLAPLIVGYETLHFIVRYELGRLSPGFSLSEGKVVQSENEEENVEQKANESKQIVGVKRNRSEMEEETREEFTETSSSSADSGSTTKLASKGTISVRVGGVDSDRDISYMILKVEKYAKELYELQTCLRILLDEELLTVTTSRSSLLRGILNSYAHPSGDFVPPGAAASRLKLEVVKMHPSFQENEERIKKELDAQHRILQVLHGSEDDDGQTHALINKYLFNKIEGGGENKVLETSKNPGTITDMNSRLLLVGFIATGAAPDANSPASS